MTTLPGSTDVGKALSLVILSLIPLAALTGNAPPDIALVLTVLIFFGFRWREFPSFLGSRFLQVAAFLGMDPHMLGGVEVSGTLLSRQSALDPLSTLCFCPLPSPFSEKRQRRAFIHWILCCRNPHRSWIFVSGIFC